VACGLLTNGLTILEKVSILQPSETWGLEVTKNTLNFYMHEF